MLTQELRIFNYIDKVQKSEDDFNNYYKVKRISYNEHRNEETSVVDCFGNKHGYFSFLISDWQPVELTEEWLLRFGFEKKSWFSEGIVIECVYYQLGNFIIYLIKDYFEVELIRKDTKQFNLFINFKKEVHILQNVFHSLTQTELTLKNEK